MFRTSTFVYLLVALGLFAYIMLIDRKNQGTDDYNHAHSILFEFDPEKVTELSINNKFGSFSFKKEGHRWNLLAPIHAVADATAVQDILDQIQNTHSQGNIPVYDSSDPQTQSNLKDWGLAPTPSSRVEFRSSDGKTFELLLGRSLEVSSTVYARCSERKNEEVKYVDAHLKEVVDRDLNSFRSRKVLDFETKDVTQLAVQIAADGLTPAQQYVAAIDKGDQKHSNTADANDKIWNLQKPLMTRANGPAVGGVISQLQSLQAITFVTDDASNLSLYGLATPSDTFTITNAPPNQKSEDIVLEIGTAVPGKTDQYYAQRLQSTSVFTVNKATIDEMVASLPRLRDLHILPIQVGNLTALSYELKGKKVSLERTKTTWTLAGDPFAVADSLQVVDIGEKLAGLVSTPLVKDSPPDLKPYGLDKPTGKLVLAAPDFKPAGTLTMLLGKTENHLTYVKTSLEPTVYTIPENALDALPVSNEAIHSPNVLVLDFRTIRSMVWTSNKGHSLHLDRSEGGTWSAPDAKNMMVDSATAERQAALFSHLRAKAWLGAPQASYGLDKPVLKMTVSFAQGSPTTLIVGAKLPDGSHAAQIEGIKNVFSLDDADFGILTANLLQPIPTVLETPTPSTASPAPASATAAPSAASKSPVPAKASPTPEKSK